MDTTRLTLTATLALTLLRPVFSQDTGDNFGLPSTPYVRTAKEIEEDRIAKECNDLCEAERYAESLEVAEALVGTKAESTVLESRLLANIILGRLNEARRIFAAEVPPLGSGHDTYEDRSGAGLPLMQGIHGYLEAKAGRCPEPLWRFLTEEFYGQAQFTKLRVANGVPQLVTQVVPTDPSPRTLEFLCIFEIAGRLGPQAREALYRQAVGLYPESPVARYRLGTQLAARAGCSVLPDGTLPEKKGWPTLTEEDRRAADEHFQSLRWVLLDEPTGREALANFRMALQRAPANKDYRKKIVDEIWIWEGRLGIRR